jgi:hypothetical protein
MWCRRILHGVLLLGLASALAISCSGSSATDMYFGTDAGAGFDAPMRETGTDVDQGVGGSSSGGSGSGGDVGSGGAGGSVDDGGTDADSGGGSGGMALIHQYQHPNRPSHKGAA